MKDYKKIAETAIQIMKEDPPSANHKPPEMIFSAELVEALDKTVKCNLPLREFLEQKNLKKSFYEYYLQYALPLLFTKDEIKGYFLAQLTAMHSGSSVIHTLDKRENYHDIVGIHYRFPGSRDENNRRYTLSVLFDITYEDLFTADLRYPKEIVAEIERCFRANKPMPHVYGLLSKYFLGRKEIPYLKILTEILLIRYGEERMQEYLDSVIPMYADRFPAYLNGEAYFQDILYFIFGHHFVPQAFNMNKIKKKGQDRNESYVCFKRMIVKSSWPMMYKHYVHRRGSVYEMMGLTDEEKEEYDAKFFGATVRRLGGARVAVTVKPEDYPFLYGSSYDEIRNAVHTYYATIVAPRRKIPIRKQALEELTTILSSTSPVRKDIRHMINIPALSTWLISLMNDEENALRMEFFQTNDKELRSEKDEIILYVYGKGRYETRTIDYKRISAPNLRREVKIYARSVLKKFKQSNISKVLEAIRFAIDMTESFHVYRCRDVRTAHVYIWLFRFTQAGLKPSTVNLKLYIIRGLMRAVMNEETYALRPDSDPTYGIVFYGVRDHVENRPIIPDDILVYLDEHISETSEDICLIYKIMRLTCWRFDDAAGLKVEDVYNTDNPEYGGIRVILDKTKKARRKRGMGDYLEDVIPIELYKDLVSFIHKTESIRKMYGTSLVFFSQYRGVAAQMNDHFFNDHINEILERGGITSIDETYESFSSSQTRATGATDLAEAGVNPLVIQKKTGHTSPATTVRYYAHVRGNTLAMKDKEFFEKKFSSLLDSDRSEKLTEDERRILYEDFIFTQEATPFGTCGKHPCTGRCGRRGTAECAECSKLVTGPKNELAWKKLMEIAQNRVGEFEALYLANNIAKDVYSKYPEFKDEVLKLQSYKAVVDKIKEWRDS